MFAEHKIVLQQPVQHSWVWMKCVLRYCPQIKQNLLLNCARMATQF